MHVGKKNEVMNKLSRRTRELNQRFEYVLRCNRLKKKRGLTVHVRKRRLFMLIIRFNQAFRLF